MKIHLVILISCISTLTNAQNLDWVKVFGNIGNDCGYSVTTDLNANIYVTGYFSDTVEFDFGTCVLQSHGKKDVFILKLDSVGNFIWAKSIGGNKDDEGYSIITDIDGNIYITGYFRGTVDFDPNAGVYNLSSTGSGWFDVFIQKLNPDGELLWAKSIGGIYADTGLSLITNSSGDIILTGYFSEIVDFDPGSGVANMISTGDEDIFILKLDSQGNYIWVKTIGGKYFDLGIDMSTDINDNLYLTGTFEDTIYVNADTLVSNGSNDIFILKLDSSGIIQWANSFGGTYWDRCNSITSDVDGNIYLTGYFNKTVDFDSGNEVYNLTSVGTNDIFIQKITPNGKHIWTKTMGDVYNDYGYSLITDANCNVYITGSFLDTVDFDPGINTNYLISNGTIDLFIQKLDSSGNLIWVKSLGGTFWEKGYSINIDLDNNIYVTGIFMDTVNFSININSNIIVSQGLEDIFILKISQNSNNYSNDNCLGNFCLFPNPADNKLYVKAKNITKISLFNMSGQLIEQHIPNSDQYILYLRAKKRGVYIVKVITDNGTAIEKIVLK